MGDTSEQRATRVSCGRYLPFLLLLALLTITFATGYNAVGWLTNHLQLDTATVGPHFIQTTRFYEVEIADSFQQVVDGPCQTL